MKSTREKKEEKQEPFYPSSEQQEQFNQAFKDVANKIIKEGVLPKDALGVTPQLLENTYAQAYRLYNTGKYAEALHLFRMLIVMDPTELKYSLGLAACYHMLKEYQNAVQLYTMCGALDPNNPIPHYHSADCFIQMKDFLSAMLCLKLVIRLSRDNPEYSKIKERSHLTLESLKQQVNEPSEFEKE